MDPLRLCLAFGPLAIYLAAVGRLNCARRPVVVSGLRDTAALWIGLSGLVLAGPVELLLPQAAVNNYGLWVWLLVGGLFALGLAFAALLGRPRLVIYNVGGEQLRPALAAVTERLDPEARWAGSCLALPKLGVELYVEPHSGGRGASLIGTQAAQNMLGWRQLEGALAAQLRETRTTASPWGAGLLVSAALLGAMVVGVLWAQPEAIVQEARLLLRL